MAKQKKEAKPKALPPKGFCDYFGTDVSERTKMLRQIAYVYHLYGFEQLESSAVETVEALGKFLPDVDRPNEGVFAWLKMRIGWRFAMILQRLWRGFTPSIATTFQAHTAASRWGRFGETKSLDLGGFVSFTNVMQIRSGPPVWLLMLRFVQCLRTRWRELA